jgi:hypothetical protein
MKITFKEMINEGVAENKVFKMAKTMLGTDEAVQVLTVPEKLHTRAREVSHKFVDTPAGPWILKLIQSGSTRFISAQSPKSTSHKLLYFVPKQG